MSVTKNLASFICTTAEPPPDVARIVDFCLLDWASVLHAGRAEPVARLVREQAKQDEGKEESQVIGLDRRLPARAASLVNGITSHALDYDDTHFASLGHPSVTVFPAVVAIADKIGASMQQVKQAALIGAETAIRIGIWLGRSHYRSGFHTTGTAGAFGATAGVAHLMELSKLQAEMALGITASLASGVKAQFGTMAKPMHAGLAAAAGIDAVLWAKAGMVAAQEGLSGPQGFSASHHGVCDYKAFEGLGQQFLLPSVSHKFHACCHGTHAMLEALKTLTKDFKLKPENVKFLQITVHPQYLDICNILEPKNGLEAKFSYKQLAAMLLCRVPTDRLDSYTDDICTDPDILTLRSRVKVQTDCNMAETSAKVLVQTVSGQFMTADNDLAKPLTIVERERKLLAKSVALIGKTRALTLWSRIDQQKDSNLSPGEDLMSL
ncbi:MmgE/PrpD family protein [Paracoccaceae bacterium]|nr:MmgE/PrpD family protein [Paracoccaceae bacterium]